MDQIKQNAVEAENEAPYEFEVQEKLRNERREIKTFDELVSYLKNIEENYNCGYGSSPRAIAQACLAVGWYLSGSFGITGFQASCVMWDFIKDWMLVGNQCGAKIVDYDKMLYPQYNHDFEKTLSKDVWENLQREAQKHLELNEHCNPKVKDHWKSIVSGVVPFGYKVNDKEE